MLTASQIRDFEKQENEHRKNVRDTFLKRDKSKLDCEKWKVACFHWHHSQSPVDFLWSRETRHAIFRGDREAIDSAICFLEVDPYYYGSGYLKEILLRALNRAPLHRHDISKLQMVLNNAVRTPPRREFPRYLCLLPKIWTPDFERQLLDEAARAPCEWKLRRLTHYLQSNQARLPKTSN